MCVSVAGCVCGYCWLCVWVLLVVCVGGAGGLCRGCLLSVWVVLVVCVLLFICVGFFYFCFFSTVIFFCFMFLFIFNRFINHPFII